eukprot:5941411-Prymnesium_polylepis.1
MISGPPHRRDGEEPIRRRWFRKLEHLNAKQFVSVLSVGRSSRTLGFPRKDGASAAPLNLLR